MKNRLDQHHRLVEIESVVGLDGIGGELGVPCTTNRLYGGLNALGHAKAAHGFLHADVDVSPPHDPGVVNRFRRETGIK